MNPIRIILVLFALALGFAPAVADSNGNDGPAQGILDLLPADASTSHVLKTTNGDLPYQATAGTIAIRGQDGGVAAKIFYTAYVAKSGRPRPLTFAFNGGPGAASAYLHLGFAGPRLLDFGPHGNDGATARLKDNPESWLRFTDLVFIDPVGTGYSRFVASGEDVRRRIWSVDGDVDAISLVIRRWLEKYDRLLSPKYVAGESYGGIRGPKVVNNLQTKQGVGVRGLILVSPVLDFRDWSGSSLLQFVGRLPSMAAVAREAKGPVAHKDLADVESYARGDFLVDLVKGQADVEATKRIADKVAMLTGIDAAVTRRLAGRLSVGEFRREFDRKNGKVTGRYDASVSGYDAYPDSDYGQFSDPSGDPLMAPLTSAAVDLTTRKLNWRPGGSYQVLSEAVSHGWNFGRGRDGTESVSDLRRAMALDPKLKLLVGHGLFDLATPYFATRIVLDQLPAYAGPDRVKFVVYPGGHMFYSRDAARKAFRGEVQAVMK